MQQPSSISAPPRDECATLDPFNHYNTEIVKLDANQWQESKSGTLVRPAESQSAQIMSESQDEEGGIQQVVEQPFNLLLDQNNGSNDASNPNEQQQQQPEMIIQSDSINNKSFTDVTFIVGPAQHSKKYVGHRVLLAMTSPVFETMFYGDMADKNKYIRIPDVAPIGFENLLRFAYTDSLNLNSVEDAMLTAYAAKKYLLPQLLRECLTYIEHNIDPSTACVVFEFAQVLNSQQLVLQAMNLIDRQTINVVTNRTFTHAQPSTVEFVANRKYLTLDSELTLFNSIVSWSACEARRRQFTNGDWLIVRSILTENSILNSIRFLTMSLEEFSKAVVKTSSLVDSSAASSKTAQASSNSSVQKETTTLSNQNHQQHNNNNNIRKGGENEQQQNDDANQQQPMDDDTDFIPISKVDVVNPNSLLNDTEQRSIFLNLALDNAALLPATINPSARARQSPPEYFTMKRFRASSLSSSSLTSSNLVTVTTSTRNIKSITSKFQCLSENIFIVALTIPIRLDVSSYSNRTPKFECHLKFTTKSTPTTQPSSSTTFTGPNNTASQALLNESSVDSTSPIGGAGASGGGGGLLDGSTLLMDTIDESLHISIARDKDCLVRLKRPILIRMGNINELTLTFQAYALDEDIVALRTPKTRSANFSEQTDGENISWLFFKTSNIEFSEIHYYY